MSPGDTKAEVDHVYGNIDDMETPGFNLRNNKPPSGSSTVANGALQSENQSVTLKQTDPVTTSYFPVSLEHSMKSLRKAVLLYVSSANGHPGDILNTEMFYQAILPGTEKMDGRFSSVLQQTALSQPLDVDLPSAPVLHWVEAT